MVLVYRQQINTGKPQLEGNLLFLRPGKNEQTEGVGAHALSLLYHEPRLLNNIWLVMILPILAAHDLAAVKMRPYCSKVV